MYERKKAVVVLVAAIFCVELGVNAWLLTHGVGVCARSTGSSSRAKWLIICVQLLGIKTASQVREIGGTQAKADPH